MAERTRPSGSGSSGSSKEDYGPGWTQLTDHGKIYLSKKVRVECHKRNAAVQTLFVQPNCAILRPQTYLTVGFGETGVGLAVYGKTRCYAKRFRVGQGAEPRDDEGVAGTQPATARKATTSYGPCPNIMAAGNMVNEEMDLAVSIERDIVCQDLKVRFEDIGGLEDAKRAINEAVILPLLMPEFFVGLRKPWKGVLLYGPPGTGKTMLAKAVASCTENITFFNCSSATLTSKWRGESEKLLRALFHTAPWIAGDLLCWGQARARVPSILFFDEIDSLLSQRGGAAEHEASPNRGQVGASRRFKSEFLIHMDGLLSDAGDQNGHLFVLATSNAPWDLDEALRRRLEKRIYIPLPEEAARQRMLEHFLKDIILSEDVDLQQLAQSLERYSGADVQLVCREASMSPMRRMVEGLTPREVLELRSEGKLNTENLCVSMADFDAAISRGLADSVSSLLSRRVTLEDIWNGRRTSDLNKLKEDIFKMQTHGKMLTCWPSTGHHHRSSWCSRRSCVKHREPFFCHHGIMVFPCASDTAFVVKAGVPICYDSFARNAFWLEKHFADWEPETFRVFRHFVRPDSVVLDVGGRRRLSMLQAALGPRRGFVPVTNRGDSADQLGMPDGHPYTVETMLGINDLRFAFPELEQVSFVKIDAEGSERDIIPAMAEFLQQTRPVVMVSLHPHALSDEELVNLVAELRAICPYVYGLHEGNSTGMLSDFQIPSSKVFGGLPQAASPEFEALCTFEPVTGTNKEVSPNDSTDFPLRCKVREQLKLEAAAVRMPQVTFDHLV
eukprot:symbB.v1.2.000808.t1/scaffold44.1/size390916/21